MCCSGVMFQIVRLQPGDSPKALAALGLKLKHKRGQSHIVQPCPAHRDSQCSIYAARPERCRIFECRQLQRVASGEITEATAREKIDFALQLVAEVNALLQNTGGTNAKHPLTQRYETAMAIPLDPISDAAVLETRERLALAMQKLSALLEQEFRVTPASPHR